jgi:NAD-dependent deacetylase
MSEFLGKYQSIVILTGAGVSAESGVNTFRDNGGVWEDHRIEDVATPEAFERDAEFVHRFYNARRRPILDQQVAPNAAHKAIAKLQSEYSGKVMLVTQNVDNLHEQGGSKEVFHMHGELLKMHCVNTHKVYDCNDDLNTEDKCECCGSAGNLRPHIVWFGEMPLYMDEIYSALAECDLFVAIGTSGNVYPAAGFVEVAGQSGAQSLEINLEESQVASSFNEARYGLAGTVVPEWVDEILAE